jgi:hypothetical protein
VDLNLDNRLTEEEQNELKRRVFSVMDQMFLEGISAGRELNREELHYGTEQYIQDKILFLSNYFLQDKIWTDNPPSNYKEKKNVPNYDAENSVFEGRIEKVEDGKNIDVDTEATNTGKPDWAIEEEKPSWADNKRPFK